MSQPASAEQGSTPPALKPQYRSLLAFLGSMNLAISLLLTLAIASAIGTVLQQNQPYNDYILKFGSWWFEVFDRLGLYDVYSAPWFLLILAFLMLSTAVCLIRQAPGMLKETNNWRLTLRAVSLEKYRFKDTWLSPHPPAAVADILNQRLQQHGFRTRDTKASTHLLVSAVKGRFNRAGYILTHLGIVVICLGGLLDSKLPFSALEWMGRLQPEFRNIPASEVPPQSRLPAWNPSFRGSVELPENGAADLLFVQWRDGYLVQDLPFTIELKDFRVEHHVTGQPKSFESDLVIIDEQLSEPLTTTIAVNKPLIHRGFAIYQSSFGDGGSKLTLRQRSLVDTQPDLPLQAVVREDQRLSQAAEGLKLEVSDFRLFNINPVLDEKTGETEQRNFGPSVIFKLRKPTGEALEFENYLAPVLLNGKQVVLTGVRSSQAEPFNYLHIPTDTKGTVERFFQLLQRLRDPESLADLVALVMGDASASSAATAPPLRQLDPSVLEGMRSLVSLFLDQGLGAIEQKIQQTAAADQQESVKRAYFQVLNAVMALAYEQVLAEEGVTRPSEAEAQWFQSAVSALGGLSLYQSPVYLQLEQFEHIQASGLQITRSPGKYVVYLGCLFLTLGVFIMFYVHQRRIWLYVDQQADLTRVLMAGSDLRRRHEFAAEFDSLNASLKRVVKPVVVPTGQCEE